AWEDESFDVRFAFFAQTDAETRIRILEGRRTRLTERLEAVRESAARTRERLDEDTRELQRHGREQVEREVSWLDGTLNTRRHPHPHPRGPAPPAHGEAGGGQGVRGSHPRAARRVHARAATSRTRAGRARGALARRSHHHRARPELRALPGHHARTDQQHPA